jgi:hypothetical protein
MKHISILCLLVVLILTACAVEAKSPIPKITPPPENKFALPVERGDYFATSGVCVICHKEMVNENGEDVSLDSFWRGTMMANSSRDPYWQASVRGEVLSNPDYDSIIQDKCTTCHTPMARTTQAFMGNEGVLLDEGFLHPENDLNTLALDGISCTLCHQIEATSLGEPESFDGHYIIDETKQVGERLSYGPYESVEADAVVMKSASGYIPVQSRHVQLSELCGSCHTLYTPTVDNNGEVAGMFPEQMPYIEWLASDYVDQNSCPDCHMPETPSKVILSVTGGPARNRFSIHSFAGGNTYALKLLQTYREELQVTASNKQIEAALDRALTQLQEQTAQISLVKSQIENHNLIVRVEVDSQVGHKFPSGFPSRRVWVHLQVMDASGQMLFESGDWDLNGSIYGNDNDLDETTFEPHYEVISDPEQVQIYEAVMGNVDAAVTTTLLRGAIYLKDNRLLPAGFDKAAVSNDIAVYGTATQDADFVDGGDQIRYQIDLMDATGPFTVVAELLYQSIGYRWAQNLNRFDAPEPQRFIGYYENVVNEPTLVASAKIEVDK